MALAARVVVSPGVQPVATLGRVVDVAKLARRKLRPNAEAKVDVLKAGRRRQGFRSVAAAGGKVVAVAAAAAPAATGLEPKGVDMKEVIERLILQEDLTEEVCEGALADLLSGADSTQTAAFLVLLRAKGETPAEIAGLARAMRKRCVPVVAGVDTLDIVGTGGDGANTVNISTGACVLAAACGARVAKHGNRSVSSACGAADVLEALGVAIDLGPEGVAQCVREVGVGFMYAPRYHPAMKSVRAVRSALRVRTAFNILGPMLNPASTPYSLIGVFSPQLVSLVAETMQRLGTKKTLVVHSEGIDELTPISPAEVLEVTQHYVTKKRISPQDLGLPTCTIDDLRGGDAPFNASILRDVFGGERGAVADALVLNAGVALAACEIAKDIPEGVAMAQEVQRSGKAAQMLQKWAALSTALRRQEEESSVALVS